MTVRGDGSIRSSKANKSFLTKQITSHSSQVIMSPFSFPHLDSSSSSNECVISLMVKPSKEKRADPEGEYFGAQQEKPVTEEHRPPVLEFGSPRKGQRFTALMMIFPPKSTVVCGTMSRTMHILSILPKNKEWPSWRSDTRSQPRRRIHGEDSSALKTQEAHLPRSRSRGATQSWRPTLPFGSFDPMKRFSRHWTNFRIPP